ncbi:MAG: outer membrane lipoprotein carrier protein LolA [Verrucomicrobiota bacterium]
MKNEAIFRQGNGIRILFLFSFMLTALVAEKKMTPAEMESIESKIEQRQANTKTLQMNFTQSVLPPGEKTPILSQGILYYQKPQNLRINYRDPAGEGLLLSSTETIQWKKGGPLQLETNDPTRPSFRRIILDVLEQKPSIWSNQFQRQMTAGDKTITVSLTPLDPQARLPDQVQVQLRSSDFQITSIEVRMKEFQWKALFSSIQVNLPLNSTLFQRPYFKDKR